jgi:hypothetical protein
MSLRLNGSTSGYSEIDAPAIAGDQTFTLPGTGGTLDRLNRAGNILQVVNATYGTGVTNSTSTYADTGLTASITPSSTSSKILIIVSQNGCAKSTNNTSLELRLLKDATELTIFASQAGATGSSALSDVGSCSTCYLDSPNTTSSVTYKTQLRSIANNAVVAVQTTNVATAVSTITLLEVAA